MNFKFNLESKKNTEEQVMSSKPELIVKRFKEWATNNHIYLDGLKSEDDIKSTLQNKRMLFGGVKAEEVIAEMKHSGILVDVVEEKAPKIKEIKYYESDHRRLAGVTKIEDDNLKKRLEENHFFEELEKNTFKNDKELDATYNAALSLGPEVRKETIEPLSYYEQFSHIVSKGIEEVRHDYESLLERKNDFKNNSENLEKDKSHKTEKAKKIATIVERGIAHLVSVVKWYGSNVTMEPTSQFDDTKRGVDDLMKIVQNEESRFIGLGIDVTYRGLLSEQYKEKFTKLLDSIRKNYKTRIKYHLNDKNEPMKEFAVPKIILFFNMDDVKDIVRMIRNIDNPGVIAEFKNSVKKFALMNQIIVQCELLSEFAKACGNDIYKRYDEIVFSIKELGSKNPEIKQIIDDRHQDEVSHHMKYLINEFKKENKIE